MNIKPIETNQDTKWFYVDDVVYGLSDDNKLIDCDGLKVAESYNHPYLDILDALIKFKGDL
jgi:hypothetical protein